MKNYVKQISDGREYHARFERTRIMNIQNTNEIIIDDYKYQIGDEDYSEVIFMPSVGRGLETWFTFNKVERIIKSGFLDYHKNFLIDTLTYSYNNEIDLEMAQTTLWGPNNQSALIYLVSRKKDIFSMNLLITDFGRFHMKVEFSNPIFVNL
jgi:hypothetical protein